MTGTAYSFLHKDLALVSNPILELNFSETLFPSQGIYCEKETHSCYMKYEKLIFFFKLAINVVGKVWKVHSKLSFDVEPAALVVVWSRPGS